MSEPGPPKRPLTGSEILKAIENAPKPTPEAEAKAREEFAATSRRISAWVKTQRSRLSGIDVAAQKLRLNTSRFRIPNLLAGLPKVEVVAAPQESLATSLRRSEEVRQDVAHVAEGFIDRLADAVVRRQEAGAAQPPSPASEPQGPAFYSTKDVWKKLAEVGFTTTTSAIQKWPKYAREHESRSWVRQRIGLAHQKGNGFAADIVDQVCREFRAQVKSLAKRLNVPEREAQDVVRAES